MKFVSAEPAAIVAGALVVSDVHLGLELELENKGIGVSENWKKTAARLNALLKQTKAKRIVVLGDFKHDVFGLENREKWLLQKFFSILKCESVTVIKGNHDSGLEGFAKVRVIPSSGMVLKEGKTTFGLFHGHAWPAEDVLKAEVLLVGNAHPAVRIREGKNFEYSKKCWLVGRTKRKKGLRGEQKTVVFPAFSDLIGGTPVNRKTLLGVLFKNDCVDLPNARVFLLDGLSVGKIKELK